MSDQGEHLANSVGDAVVWQEGDMAIARSDRAFGVGFNVYRLGSPDRAGHVRDVKINPAMSWFTSLDAALAWVQSEEVYHG